MTLCYFAGNPHLLGSASSNSASTECCFHFTNFIDSIFSISELPTNIVRIMDEKERDLEAGVASPTSERAPPDQRTPSGARSCAGSTSTEVDYDKITAPGRQNLTTEDKSGTSEPPETIHDDSDSEGEDMDHGEPDVDHKDAESAVLGRDLDRQLSRVGSPSPPAYESHSVLDVPWHER